MGKGTILNPILFGIGYGFGCTHLKPTRLGDRGGVGDIQFQYIHNPKNG